MLIELHILWSAPSQQQVPATSNIYSAIKTPCIKWNRIVMRCNNEKKQQESVCSLCWKNKKNKKMDEMHVVLT